MRIITKLTTTAVLLSQLWHRSTMAITCPGSQEETAPLDDNNEFIVPDLGWVFLFETFPDLNRPLTFSQDPSPGSIITGNQIFAITLSATDGTNTESCSTILEVADRTAPNITIEGVEDGDYFLSSSPPVISASAVDAIDGPLTAVLRMNGDLYTPGMALTPGIYFATAMTSDTSGNKAVLEKAFMVGDEDRFGVDLAVSSDGPCPTSIDVMVSCEGNCDPLQIIVSSVSLWAFDSEEEIINEDPIKATSSTIEMDSLEMTFDLSSLPSCVTYVSIFGDGPNFEVEGSAELVNDGRRHLARRPRDFPVTPPPTQTDSPTPSPSESPVASPPTTVPPTSVAPTPTQTISITPGPTPGPTPGFSPEPTMATTPGPSPGPTPGPTPGSTPGFTPEPTGEPSSSPAGPPTPSPSSGPSFPPSREPSSPPSDSPTSSPSSVPTIPPSSEPSSSPSSPPTPGPSTSPTIDPSPAPTVSPSSEPTLTPSGTPTGTLSSSPSIAPTAAPTETPSTNPTFIPSGSGPSVHPTPSPSESPTNSPSLAPSVSCAPSSSFSPTETPTPPPTVSEVPSSAPSASPCKWRQYFTGPKRLRRDVDSEFQRFAFCLNGIQGGNGIVKSNLGRITGSGEVIDNCNGDASVAVAALSKVNYHVELVGNATECEPQIQCDDTGTSFKLRVDIDEPGHAIVGGVMKWTSACGASDGEKVIAVGTPGTQQFTVGVVSLSIDLSDDGPAAFPATGGVAGAPDKMLDLAHIIYRIQGAVSMRLLADDNRPFDWNAKAEGTISDPDLGIAGTAKCKSGQCAPLPYAL